MTEEEFNIYKQDLNAVIAEHGEEITLAAGEETAPAKAIMREVGEKPDFVRRDPYEQGRWFTVLMVIDSVANPAAVTVIRDAIGCEFEVADYQMVGRPAYGVRFAATYDDRVRAV